jgi:hypothetical protein
VPAATNMLKSKPAEDAHTAVEPPAQKLVPDSNAEFSGGKSPELVRCQMGTGHCSRVRISSTLVPSEGLALEPINMRPPAATARGGAPP